MGDQLTLDDVIRTRRSVRLFDSRPIEPEKLDRVLELATKAPSAGNKQPWRFIVVQDEAHRKEIARLALDQMWIAQAPVVIVCCGEPYWDRWSRLTDKIHLVDMAIVIDHLTLAARAEGLGTCWVGAISEEDHASMKSVLEVPDGFDIVMVVPIGYPAEGEEAFQDTGTRRPVAETVFRDRFGQR
jgi:nitroreductase